MMASITIMHSHKNLFFAAAVAKETGATFEEEDQWITISDSPRLTIPRYCLTDALGGQRNATQQEQAWRSLLLNKKGFLMHFGDTEIVIEDEKPQDPRPQFLLRFPSPEAKKRAEEWAERTGFDSLTAYILAAIEAANQVWAQSARDTEKLEVVVDREKQIAWIRRNAEDLAYQEGTAEEKVECFLNGIAIPEWFDVDHDRGLLVNFVAESLQEGE